MGRNIKADFYISLILLGAIIAFAFLYNSSVTKTVTDELYNDQEILQEYNTEIIEKLKAESSIENWTEIIEQYEDVVIVIENSKNKVVIKSEGRYWSALDVKVQTPFHYQGEAYLIKSSVYFLRDYLTDVRTLVQFIFVEFLIGLTAICLLFFVVYTIFLSPFRKLSKAIEEYDKTGKLKQVRIKGYAGEVYKRFELMTKNLAQQQNNQRRIIASISHDIKTPLTSIMGYTEGLKKEGLSEERKKRYLNTVYQKGEEIRALIDEFDDYLDFNMHSEFTVEVVKLVDFCNGIVEEYGDELENTGVEFTLDFHGDKDALIAVDKQKIKRVLGNIFSNSIKHFKNDEKKITVEIFTDKEKVYINVDDSGEGVDKDKLDVIFEPLYTSDQGRKVAGLGLAICRDIIDGHSGRIYAERSVYGGLRICIELERIKTKSKQIRTNG